MRDKSCSECKQLWREYASATAEHLKLESQMGMASYDSRLYEVAKRATEVAEHERESARIEMKEHETLRHCSLAAAATAI